MIAVKYILIYIDQFHRLITIRNLFSTMRYISWTQIPFPGDSDSVIRYLRNRHRYSV